MISRLRSHLGTAGLVVAIVALIAALAGGALAASGGGGKATASAKAKRGPKGPKGPKGDTGPAGPQGPAGPAGKDGSNGTNGGVGPTGPTGKTGATGAEGEDGQPGQSVTSTESAGTIDGTHCVGRGGSKFVASNGSSYACNGATGATGSPWTAGGTLPPGVTETGAWSSFPAPGNASSTADGSFTVPLAAPLDWTGTSSTSHVHFVYKEGSEMLETNFVGGVPAEPEFQVSPAFCTGTVENPTASAGHLCVYTESSQAEGLSINNKIEPIVFKPYGDSSTNLGAGTTGFRLKISVSSPGYVQGTWAVTAPTS